MPTFDPGQAPGRVAQRLCALALAFANTAHANTGHTGGFDTLVEAELCRDVAVLADPRLEGRDSPSIGLEAAARYIEERFKQAGLQFARGPSTASAGEATDYRHPFARTLPEPDLEHSQLALTVDGGAPQAFKAGSDFVPVVDCSGTAAGELVFVGFGIQSKSEHYDDLEGLNLRGRIALIAEGEPRHAKRFEGAELSSAASLWSKLDDLRKAGVAGVLVARRPPPPAVKSANSPAAATAAPLVPDLGGKLGFRHTWAEFNGVARDPAPREALPVLELSSACASALLGEDVLLVAEKIDKQVRPQRVKLAGRKVTLSSQVREASVRIDNVVGMIPGSDPALASEYVVIGAHYDHLGIDPRGRLALGADDNASGTAGMLELAEALALAKPRRSVIACAFAAEEDGLLGSKAFCDALPVPKERIVAMINLDMIGRGDPAQVAVLGITQNPSLEKLLGRAKKLKATGIKDVIVRQGEELFARSDHHSFHKLGIPVLFFFEGLPIDKNKDYHTWRDTLDEVDCDKVLRTVRLVYNTLWLLANEDERPPPPHG